METVFTFQINCGLELQPIPHFLLLALLRGNPYFLALNRRLGFKRVRCEHLGTLLFVRKVSPAHWHTSSRKAMFVKRSCSPMACAPCSSLQTMHAHSQFCMSGDHTLEGTEHAIKDITKEEADEYFVIILSDANLSRYGINPARFAQILTSDPQVNAFAIFIGSLGDQAAR